MKNKVNLLEYLHQLLSEIYLDIRLYKIAANNERQLQIRNFYEKLVVQKKAMGERTNQEIKYLYQEINLEGESPEILNVKNGNNTVLPVIDFKGDSIKRFYRRENQNIAYYDLLLSKINQGEIREMLLSQKFTCQLIINEIKTWQIEFSEKNNKQRDIFPIEQLYRLSSTMKRNKRIEKLSN